MTLKRRQFTRDFKLQILQEADSAKSIGQLAREHQVHPTLIHRSRLTRSGAFLLSLDRQVLRTALRRDTPLIAAMRIRRATRLRPARMPDSRSSAWMRGAP